MTTDSRHSPLLVLYNPVCGHGQAKALFDETIVPLLRKHNKDPSKIVATEHPGHAGEVVLQFLAETEGAVTVVLGSGDGTLHEIVDALHKSQHTQTTTRELKFVLVPCGTANALYASCFPPASAEVDANSVESKLGSINTFLRADADSSRRPITVAKTVIADANADTHPSTSVTVVVASTSLHASILHDSEALRATIPGIERFKVAAMQNLTRWYQANVTLFAARSPTKNDIPVEIYDSKTKTLVPYKQPESGDVELQGPFCYFLSTMNVDRLEPTFRISPLYTKLPPHAGSDAATVDILIIRPMRDRTMRIDSDHDREVFAKKCMTLLGGAYADGAHIDMQYGTEQDIIVKQGNGELMVEYFRCGGWKWLPVSPNRLQIHCHERY